MMSTCPTCGQRVPQRPAAGRTEEILSLLQSTGDRYIYRHADGTGWSVTQHRHHGRPFAEADVMSLVEAGQLAPVYPGTSGEKDAYGLSGYYASRRYLRDLKAKIERRRDRTA